MRSAKLLKARPLQKGCRTDTVGSFKFNNHKFKNLKRYGNEVEGFFRTSLCFSESKDDDDAYEGNENIGGGGRGSLFYYID